VRSRGNVSSELMFGQNYRCLLFSTKNQERNMNPSVASNFNVLTSAARDLLAAFLMVWRISVADGENPSISRDGNGIEINFIGVLQSADSVAGPWVDESGETPRKVIPSGAARYYRAKPFELPAAAHFTVNLETGEVGVFPGSALSREGFHASAVFGGSTIGFNSSLVLAQAGDPGEKVLSVSLVNQSGRTVGLQPNGIPSDIKVIFSDFKNLSTPSDLRLQTTVSTLAGTGTLGSSDGPALSATFNRPTGVAKGPDGSIYICDAHKVRKLSHQQVFTLAGSGTASSVDGIGTAASMNNTWGIAYSAHANALVIVERNGRRIRLLTLDGKVTTVAGTGALGSVDGTGDVATFNDPTAVAVDASGAIYVGEYLGQRIRKVTLTGPDPGVATSYTVTTWAGSGVSGSADGTGTAAQFRAIYGLAAEQDGTLYVADSGNSKIRRVSTQREVVTIAGTGAAGSLDGSGKVAQFNGPAGVALANGSLVITESVANKVRLLTLTPGGTIQNAADWQVRTLAGTGASGAADGRGNAAQFNSPLSLTPDGAGNLVVADYLSAKLRKLTPTAGYFPVGIPNPTIVTEPVQVSNAKGVYTFATGAGQTYRPYISYNETLFPGGTSKPQNWAFVVPDGVNGFEFNVTVVAPSETQVPLAVVSNPGPSGNGSPDILVSTLAGTSSAGYVNGQASVARFNGSGITVDGEGNVYVADTYNNAIRRIGKDLVVSTISGGVDFTPDNFDFYYYAYPPGIVVTPDGQTVYVADSNSHSIIRIASNGGDPRSRDSWSTAIIAGGPALGPGYLDNTGGNFARFYFPWGIVWAPGNVLYVTEFTGQRVRRLQALGGNLQDSHNWYVSLVAGDVTVPAGVAGFVDGNGSSARFSYPLYIAIDRAGFVYVADEYNHRIRKIDPDGNVTTLAGSSNGYADGNGPAALFSFPSGIAVDNAGYVYVSEMVNNRIRRVSPGGTVSTLTSTLSSGDIDGTGDAASVVHPYGLAIDTAGTLYTISGSSGASRIRMIQRILR
jgi:sugar lactone lactonase YvrE